MSCIIINAFSHLDHEQLLDLIAILNESGSQREA